MAVLGELASMEIWKDLAKVLGAFVLTVVIGWDREREEHTTGVRTFPIVGMASCGYLLILNGTTADSSRVLQGLITGIGFVGAGAILKEGSTVRGTATAASVWNAGAIGASVALDHYGIGIALALLNLLSMRALLPLKNRLDKEKKAES
ncbi:MAG TPA: MgtC/SapB family protein [Bryobacteraceae bacterium]|nr:MgtC/SapB family protein [Bryobacteraceae bacterium]